MTRIFKERKLSASLVRGMHERTLFADAPSHSLVPAKMDILVKQAEDYLQTPIPLLPLSVYLEFRENGNRARYEAIYFQRRDMALTLALAEAYEHRGRFTAKLADTVWAIMEESSWIIPAHLYTSPTHGECGVPPVYDGTRLHGIDLFSAGTAGALAAVLTLTKEELDSISPLICEKLTHQFHERIIKPFLNCAFWWTGERGDRVNNWCPWIISNILHVAAVTVEDIYILRKLVTKAMNALDNFSADYQPDGGCSEGPSYWGAAGASYFDCLELLHDMSGGAIDVYDHPLVKNMFEYIVKFNIHGKRFINFADCPPQMMHDGAMIRRMGEKCGSESLIAFGDTMARIANIRSGLGAHSHAYRLLRSLMTESPSSGESRAEQSVWFPDLKVMVWRADEDSSKGLFIAAKGGNNNEHHNHNDVGNVIVCYNGNPVLIDTGAGEYTKKTFSSRRYELWFMQSDYHNLPAFGGVSQREGKQYASSGEIYSPETGAAQMELTGAYPQEAALISFTRAVVPQDDSSVTITDTVEMAREQEVDFRYMTCAEPRLMEVGKLLLAEGRVMIYDPRLTCEIEAFPVNDPGIERNWHTDTLWRIHFKAVFTEGQFAFTVK